MEDDHEDDHDDHDDDIHLAIHREADELGKFASHLQVHSPKPLSQQEAVRFLDELLYQISRSCLDHGADLIGHVKAFLKAENGAMSASLIDVEKRSNVTHDFGQGARFQDAEITLHVIVHGIWDDKVKEQSLGAMDRVFKQFSLDYVILKDYIDTEKSISHHLK